MKDNQVCNYDQFINKTYLIGGCAVGDAEVESEDLPGALVVQDDALGAEVAMEHLDAVVQEVQTLAQLQTKLL